jgi:hypothetical protein
MQKYAEVRSGEAVPFRSNFGSLSDPKFCCSEVSRNRFVKKVLFVMRQPPSNKNVYLSNESRHWVARLDS